MRKILFLLAITLIWVSHVDSQSIRLTANQTWKSYTGVAGDTAKATTAKNFDIFVGKNYMYYYDIGVSADSLGDANNFSVQLSGSNDETNWYTIGSAVTWYLTESDTVLRFTNMTDVSIATSIAATFDYHDFDSITSKTWTDTVTIGARAITETLTEASVGWRYLRVGFTGAAAGAKCEIQTLTVAIKPKVFSY